MEQNGVLWGAGNAATETMDLTCTGCHDPHGSSNYRLLKDSVNGNAVGGYTPAGVPQGMVFSVETNYPYADNGWLKHEAGQIQMGAYRPDYTAGSADIRAGVAGDSLSAWCSACHEEYDEQSSAYDYGTYEGGGAIGSQTRHRHPVDITLAQGDDIIQVAAQGNADVDGLDPKIPLEINPGVGSVRMNQVGCLTCHFAHGSNADMSGWAAAHYQDNAGSWIPVRDATPGVEPDKEDIVGVSGAAGTSALLRADNRGVCERCHEK
jgi:cytochrome c553